MDIIRLCILFLLILLVNFCLIKIDYSKLFKPNSYREIKIFVYLISIAIGYLLYRCMITIYELSQF